MAQFIYGAIGVIVALILFAAGCLLGWKLNDSYRAHAKQTVAKELTETERIRAKEDAEAFNTMMNYSSDVAYGITKLGDKDNGE